MQKSFNARNFYGEIKSKNGEQGYNIKFDEFPEDFNLLMFGK